MRSMGEIYQFKVFDADAKIENGGMTVRLFYPRNPEPMRDIIKENLPFGINVFENLITDSYSRIADEKNPAKTASAGMLFLLNDGSFICHRRDKYAPTHKLYHCINGGYTKSRNALYTEKGLVETGIRESVEESLIVTNEEKPRIIVPDYSDLFSIVSKKTARNLGLKLEPKLTRAEVLEPTDTLEVYDADENLIFKHKAFIDLLYESSTSVNVLDVVRLPFSSEEVRPIDTEGTEKDGKFIHFDRESYVINKSEIENKKFGHVLKNPKVYKTRIENGKPTFYRPQYSEPYLGPNGVQVTNPHVWAPEDMLCRTLNAIGVEGYKWMEMELWKEKMKLEGKSILPASVLKN